MTITKAKHTFILHLTLMTVMLGFFGAYVINKWIPNEYPPLYPSIPIFFYVYGILFINLYSWFYDKKLMVHLIGKTAKLLLGLMFVGIYAHFVRVHIKTFLLTFLVYYFIYLIFESYFFLQQEMDLKKEMKK